MLPDPKNRRFMQRRRSRGRATHEMWSLERCGTLGRAVEAESVRVGDNGLGRAVEAERSRREGVPSGGSNDTHEAEAGDRRQRTNSIFICFCST